MTTRRILDLVSSHLRSPTPMADAVPGTPPVVTIGSLILDEEAKAASKAAAAAALADATQADATSFTSLVNALTVVGPTARSASDGGFDIYRADGKGGLAPVEHVGGFDAPVPVAPAPPAA